MLSRIAAYLFAGVPAAIAVVFVASYGFRTADPDTAAASAALYGMVAAAAFGLPAYALAVANAGRKLAAWIIGALALFAIVANWSNSLAAIALRGAGTEAASEKAKADQADAHKELERIAGRINALGKFTPTSAAAVEAAREAVTEAERARKAECGNGDPRQRGKNCRAYEATEQVKRDALAGALTAKATTDAAARLETEAAAIRAKLGKAGPIVSNNSLGETLSRILPLSAVTAATLQQSLVALIVELFIAAILAAPELLRPPSGGAVAEPPEAATEPNAAPIPAIAASPERRRTIAGVPMLEPPRPERLGSVAQFMLACLPRAQGQEVALSTIYARYRRWCDEQKPAVAAEDAPAFAEEFKALSERVRLCTEKRGNRIVVRDVQLVA